MDTTLIRAVAFLFMGFIALRAGQQTISPPLGMIPLVDNDSVKPEQMMRMMQAAESKQHWDMLITIIAGIAAILLCPWLGPL